MDERTYWVIATSNVRTPNAKSFLKHRMDEVGYALCLFTDYQRAKDYIGQVFWTNQINWDYNDEHFLRVSAGDLADFLATSVPGASPTHVLIDPEFGDERNGTLQPVARFADEEDE
jgi:hypothetical protein